MIANIEIQSFTIGSDNQVNFHALYSKMVKKGNKSRGVNLSQRAHEVKMTSY